MTTDLTMLLFTITAGTAKNIRASSLDSEEDWMNLTAGISSRVAGR
jgi:hypothetical protein